MDFSKLTPQQIKKMNERTVRETEKEYIEFKDALKRDECYLCHKKFSYFSIDHPCIHWLLRPSGFDKKHFPIVFTRFDYWRINPYLRWLANSEALFRNINDLVEEKCSSKVVEQTIKYKNFEWSFSCSKTDITGHSLKIRGRKPHYHFQMKIDGNIFIKYSDFHIPFTDYDLWVFAIVRNEFDQIKHVQTHGMGMQGVIDELPPRTLLDAMINTSEESEATWNPQTIVEAMPGKTISGDEIADLIKKSIETKIPIARLIKNLKNIKIKTIIMPGPGVPKIAARKGGRKKNE